MVTIPVIREEIPKKHNGTKLDRCELCRNRFAPKIDTEYYENNMGFCIKLMRLISNNYGCEDFDHSDNLTPKQRENHRKMVEDMTGRKIL